VWQDQAVAQQVQAQVSVVRVGGRVGQAFDFGAHGHHGHVAHGARGQGLGHVSAQGGHGFGLGQAGAAAGGHIGRQFGGREPGVQHGAVSGDGGQACGACAGGLEGAHYLLRKNGPQGVRADGNLKV
jgi:hypothetical protein